MKSQSNFRATSRESLIARLSLIMQNIQVEVKSFGGYMWVWRCVGDMFFSVSSSTHVLMMVQLDLDVSANCWRMVLNVKSKRENWVVVEMTLTILMIQTTTTTTLFSHLSTYFLPCLQIASIPSHQDKLWIHWEQFGGTLEIRRAINGRCFPRKNMFFFSASPTKKVSPKISSFCCLEKLFGNEGMSPYTWFWWEWNFPHSRANPKSINLRFLWNGFLHVLFV